MSLLPTIGAVDQDTGFYNGEVTNSLRVNAGHTLSRAFGASPTSSTTMSFGGWVKFSAQHYQNFFSSTLGGSGVAQAFMRLNGDLKLEVDSYNGSAYFFNYRTTRVFRDTSAWYHIWVQIDTTDGTDSNRVKIYVNGVRETAFDATTHVSSGSSSVIGWNTNTTHYFGYNNASYGLGGYIADWYFLDGQDVSPIDTVGEFKNGIFIPKAYSATFGNKGFHLKFIGTGTSTSSGSVANPTNIGDDSSGQNNHWAVTSSGILSHDANMPDSPENNFATLNTLSFLTDNRLVEGNLQLNHEVTSHRANTVSIAPLTGKWYFEVYNKNNTAGNISIGIGLQDATKNLEYGSGNDNYIFYCNSNAAITSLNTTTNSLSSFTPAAGNIMQVAYDFDSGKLFIGKNDTYIAADSGTDGNPATGANPTATLSTSLQYLFYVNIYNNVITCNFGQDDTFAGAISSAGNTDGNGIGKFKYAPPSGFLALCSANLPEPTIGPNSTTQAVNHFGTLLYTGDGNNSRNIVSGGTNIDGEIAFTPDWLWIKRKDGDNSHVLVDSSRGKGSNDSLLALLSNDTGPDLDDNDHVRSLDSNGFTLDDDTDNTYATNNSSQTYVAWNWKANGGTTSSNSDGSITSTVQANTDAGFSIVLYAGSESNATVGHGLGGVPDMLIWKKRNGVNDWIVYHSQNTSEPATDHLHLNNTNATGDADTFFQDTLPTSTVFSIGTDDDVNDAKNYVVYCFRSIEGYSKFGSYTGNASDDGVFVFTGFDISFLMIKCISTTGNFTSWTIYDNKRKTFNDDTGVNSNPLYANKGAGEGERGNGTTDISSNACAIDFLSNGFKPRDNANEINQGDVYIYMAFAEAPFKYANAK